MLQDCNFILQMHFQIHGFLHRVLTYTHSLALNFVASVIFESQILGLNIRCTNLWHLQDSGKGMCLVGYSPSHTCNLRIDLTDQVGIQSKEITFFNSIVMKGRICCWSVHLCHGVLQHSTPPHSLGLTCSPPSLRYSFAMEELILMTNRPEHIHWNLKSYVSQD